MTLFETARLALEEDFALNDVTTSALDSFLTSRAEAMPEHAAFYLVAKQAGVFAGRAWAEAVCELMELEITALHADGQLLAVGDVLLRAHGNPRKILAAERTLLNGLQYACGVATLTRAFVEKVELTWKQHGASGTAAPGVYHTRKTPPLLRALAVDAVVAGGGRLHRQHLADRVLFKENHKQWVLRAGLSLSEVVAYFETWGFEDALIEVETIDEAVTSARAGAKYLLLDNFTPEQVQECLARLPAGLQIEVSGGLSFEGVARYCRPGVTRLSVGALTRDVRTLDLSLDWEAV
ncbi:MAG: hypothetical protein JST16_00160 [Bdellovibrionales bacterium]|nr:hypothetical protein [Bdellovibrionales bacterium]